MAILPRRFTHIARAWRRCHRTVLPRNLVARLRHHMAEHEARIGCIHDRFHSVAIARFRCAGMEQRHVIARRNASIGYGAMRTQIDSIDMPKVLCWLAYAAEKFNARRNGLSTAGYRKN